MSIAIINSTKIFLVFSVVQAIFLNINFYQAKYIQPTLKELAKYNFYLLIVYWLLNIVITMVFSIAINKYNLPSWMTNVIYWVSAVIPTIVISYFWFGQVPNITQAIGMIVILLGIMMVIIR